MPSQYAVMPFDSSNINFDQYQLLEGDYTMTHARGHNYRDDLITDSKFIALVILYHSVASM